MPKAGFLPVTLLAVAVFALALPAVAAAEAIVPPGNSAAAQYTEAFPTSGGEKETGEGKKAKPTPNQTLGGRNARNLESKGAEGKAVADFAAETAPTPVATPVEQSGGGGGTAGAGDAKEAGDAKGQAEKADKADKADRGSGDDEGKSAAGAGGGSGGSGGAASQPSGSSGLGEVLGQATGSSSSGKLGLLLPLIIVGAVAWSLFFLWRQKQRVA